MIPPGWDEWDLVRATIAVLALLALVRMAVHVGQWVRLPLDERFLWVAVVFLTASTGYGAWDLLGSGVPGGDRLVWLVASMVYLNIALTLHHWHDRRRRRVPAPIDA